MFVVNPSGMIILPRGDTLSLTIQLEVNGAPAEFPEGTVAVFGIYSSKRQENLLKKQVPIIGNIASIRLSNADTRELAVGNYTWDLRIVTDPEYRDGNVVCEDSADEVISIFSGSSSMPVFMVTEVATDV